MNVKDVVNNDFVEEIAVYQIFGDARGPKTVIANLRYNAGEGCVLANHDSVRLGPLSW